MSELATAVNEKIKVIVIILNNHYLGMVRQWQELFYEQRFSGTALTAPAGRAEKGQEVNPAQFQYIPNFAKLAEEYGLKGYRITKNSEVEPTLKKAFASKETVILDVLIQPQEKVFPMIPAGQGLDDIIVDMA
jgi:acetolactate synthase-1/2/3 large subunit